MAPGKDSTPSPAYGQSHQGWPVAASTSRKVAPGKDLTTSPVYGRPHHQGWPVVATITVDALSANITPPTDSEPGMVSWAMDSGASHHICHDRASMVNLRSTNTSVRLGENTTLRAEAIGEIKIKQGPFLIEALLIPQFRISLLSIPCMDARGYTSTFNNGIGTVEKGVRQVRAKLQDGLYRFTTTPRNRSTTMSSFLAKSSASAKAHAVSTRSMTLKQSGPSVVIQVPVGGTHDDMTPPPAATPKHAPIAPPATVPKDVIVHRHRGKRASAAEWHRRLGHMHAEGLKKVLHPELLSDKIQTNSSVGYASNRSTRYRTLGYLQHAARCRSKRCTPTCAAHSGSPPPETVTIISFI